MSEPFVAEIRMFPFWFAPRGWATCDGQILPISQNTALFALLGTMYGGNGQSTFALPNLQGASPMDAGAGQGLTPRFPGEMGGSEAVTLIASEMPSHAHAVNGINAFAASNDPAGRALARPFGGGSMYFSGTPSSPVTLNPQALAPAGGSLPHNNMQPYLVVNFCIAMQGAFPQRG